MLSDFKDETSASRPPRCTKVTPFDECMIEAKVTALTALMDVECMDRIMLIKSDTSAGSITICRVS